MKRLIAHSLLFTLAVLFLPLVIGKTVLSIQKGHRIGTPSVFYAGGNTFVVPNVEGDEPSPWWANGLPINYVSWSDCLAGCVGQFSAKRLAVDFIFWFLASLFLFTWLSRTKTN